MDRSERPWYPRWVAYLNVWAGLLYIEASLILFFKHGAFSQDGFAVFYVPVIVFFAWVIVLSAMVIRAANAERRLLEKPAAVASSTQSPTAAVPA
jgi:hypothetical protein